MKKGIDIELEDNNIESLINAVKMNDNLFKEHGVYDLGIDEIRLDYDYDENKYYLQIRFKKNKL